MSINSGLKNFGSAHRVFFRLLSLTIELSRFMTWRMCRKYYDIGLNLTDPMFQGIYNGKQYHASDLVHVLSRAAKVGVHKALLTGSSITESRQAAQIAQSYGSSDLKLFYTVGVHPCCVNEFANHETTIDSPSNDEELNQKIPLEVLKDTRGAQAKLQELYHLVNVSLHEDPLVRAIGEIGLDYDRLYYASKEMQLMFFEEQLKLSCLVDNPKVPLFLHMRTSCDDFVRIMQKFIVGFQDHDDRFQWGDRCSIPTPITYKFYPDRKFVTHSFTGTSLELKRVLELSPQSYIGLNGCSLKSEENIQCAREVPLERLLLETDAPWCDVRRTHASFQYLGDYKSPYSSVKKDKLAKMSDSSETTVKGRNEPCNIEQVARIVANLRGIDLSHVVDQVWQTSCEVYGS